MHVIDRGLPDITVWATWAAQGSRPKAVEILAEVPQGSLLQQATLEPIKSRLQSALEAHGICDCLPASDCREDRTLRKAKTPEVSDCRVEPPPPQRRDPFIFRAKIGPMEEILIVNLDQLDEQRRPTVVHRAKNGTSEVSSVIVPDDNPKMPRTGDHLVVVSRKYTNQIVDGQNVAGPWSDPHICVVAPPRDAAGQIVRGYSEDMREPYLFKQDIGFCAEGDLRAPGKRLFYSTAPFTIAPGTEIKLYANTEVKHGGENWVEIGRTKSTLSGMFLLEASSPIGGDEGYRMEIVQPGRKDPVQFDPIIHQPFGSDQQQVSRALIDHLFDALPLDTAIDVTAGPRIRDYATFELCSPSIAPSDQVKVTKDGCDALLFEANGKGVVSGRITGEQGERASAFVQKQIGGKSVWVPLGSFELGKSGRVEGSALPIAMSESPVKPGQRLRAVNEETDRTTMATAGPKGALSLILPDTSRGDLIRYELEDWVNNQRTWLPLFTAQLDSARECGAARETGFTSTVDAPPATDGWTKLAELFSVGAGKDVPADRRRLFVFGAAFGAQTSRTHLGFDKFGFAADADTLEWFRRGFEFGRDANNLACVNAITHTQAAKIDVGRSYQDSRRVEERCTPSVRNISGLTGRFRTEYFTRKMPDRISIGENAFGITSGVAQANGY